MRADYDSTANAISIAIVPAAHADASDEVHPRAIVALRTGQAVEVQLLYPDSGIAEPVVAVADRYGIDSEALLAAAQSALAAPDRVVYVEVEAGRRSDPPDLTQASRSPRVGGGLRPHPRCLRTTKAAPQALATGIHGNALVMTGYRRTAALQRKRSVRRLVGVGWLDG